MTQSRQYFAVQSQSLPNIVNNNTDVFMANDDDTTCDGAPN